MKKILLLLLLMPSIAKTQIITTVAGTDIAGFSGEGGPASTANLNRPDGICADATGNIYFADYQNHRVRKISTGGIISTIAGNGVAGYSGDGGPATSASLNHPVNVVVDTAGNIYCSETANNRIRKINTSGIISTFAGNGTGGYSGDGGPATNARLNFPYGLTIDPSGNLYIGDRDNQRIRIVTPSGTINTFAGNGTGGFSGDGGLATAASIWSACYVHSDAAGNIFISDNQNQRIRKVNTASIITTYAGNGISSFTGDGGAATAASISYPSGITTDNLGNLYFSDYNQRIRKINDTGIISTICGNGIAGFSGDGGPATAASLNEPLGVVYTNTGALYIVDNLNNRIRKMQIGIANYTPTFTGGPSQTLTICEGSVPVSINSLLSIMDTDMGQTETWSLEIAPAHGIASVAYSNLSTGSPITPVGLTYTTVSGFVGSDIFKVKVNDGIDSSITTIFVTVNPMPNAGTISGIDSVCPGTSDTLSETTTGGIWSSSNILISGVSSAGVVTGFTPGTDTIIYSVINSCGIESAILPIHVGSYTICHTGLNNVSNAINKIELFPNPANSELLVKSTEVLNNIVISSVTGQMIFKKECLTMNEVIDISTLAKGMYFIKINGNEVRKFIKQ